MPAPAYTPTLGGFVTVRTLPDGRTLIEGWALNFTPPSSDEPCHEVAYHYIATTEADALETVAEFVGWLDQPLGAATYA